MEYTNLRQREVENAGKDSYIGYNGLVMAEYGYHYEGSIEQRGYS